MAKIAPSVTRLWFHINPNNNYNFVDLSLAASAANRRFYRQGTTWAVAGMSLVTQSNTTGVVDVSKMPDTWMAKNSHTMVKKLWMKSQDQVLDDQPSIAAKYRDFKIYLDKEMVGAAVQSVGSVAALDQQILLPVDRLNLAILPGEWTYSTIQLPVDGGSASPKEVTMHMVGDDSADSRGLIHGYGLARSRPQTLEPNTPSDQGWITGIFDTADNLDEIRLDVTDNNDYPPYRVGDTASGFTNEYYPGGANNHPYAALHSVANVTGTTVGGKTHIEGGMFGCGLIRFDWDLDPAGDTQMWLAIDLVPGSYKGYLTEVY